MFYEEILIDLARQNVRFVLIGGMAVNFHGYDRTTGDLDILLDMSKENLGHFLTVVHKRQLKPAVPVQIDDLLDEDKRHGWIQNKNMIALALLNPERDYERLDVVLESSISFEEAFSNGKKITFGSEEIILCSIDDLIKMKQQVNREVDKIDIEALKKIKELKGDE